MCSLLVASGDRECVLCDGEEMSGRTADQHERGEHRERPLAAPGRGRREPVAGQRQQRSQDEEAGLEDAEVAQRREVLLRGRQLMPGPADRSTPATYGPSAAMPNRACEMHTAAPARIGASISRPAVGATRAGSAPAGTAPRRRTGPRRPGWSRACIRPGSLDGPHGRQRSTRSSAPGSTWGQGPRRDSRCCRYSRVDRLR